MSASMNVLSPRPSLLDRRASNNIPDTPDHLSVADLFPHTSPSSSLTRGRRSSAGVLPFVPLTPIMASPLLTPEVVHAPTPAAVFETAARQTVPGHAHRESDYITHHPFTSNPTWTTCPPTPPPKNTSPRLAPSTSSPPARATRHRSRTRSVVADRANSRPASIAYFPSSSLSQSHSPSSLVTAQDDTAHVARLSVRRLSLPSDLSKPLPPPPRAQPDGAPKDLPPVPLRCQSAPKDADIEETLLPSLSRRAPTNNKRSASLGSNSCETRTLRVAGRKLFDLEAHEADLSDDEDVDHGAYKEEKSPSGDEDVREREMGQMRAMEREKEKAERLRRYHALMELLTTEVGYLLDLRVLVTVYLDQLVLLSSPSSAPAVAGPPTLPMQPLGASSCLNVLPPPSRPMSTFSALSIPSLFPSSRTSIVQTSPLPSLPPSASEALSGDGTDGNRPCSRERQHSGELTNPDSVREREREKEYLDRMLPLKTGKARSPGPILIEREVRAVCRNAQELLRFHERFVRELREAVSRFGLGEAFPRLGEQQPVLLDDEATEMIERAVEVVAEKFVNEAASFSIYETFCPGHAAATDLLRRVQERWPSVWETYDQRCALLVSHTPFDVRPGESKHGSEPEISSTTSPASEVEDTPVPPPTTSLRKRRHSTPALSVVFPVSSSFNGADPSERGEPPVSPPSATAPILTMDTRVRGSSHRLQFMDYLIKPVQRLCKYPLLLDQLQDRQRKHSASESGAPVDGSEASNAAVMRALEAMRGVVSRVNFASEKEAHNLRSALIASRIAFSFVLPHAGSTSSGVAPSAPLPTVSSPSSSECAASSHGHSNSVSSCSAVSTAPTSPASSPIAFPPSRTRASSLTADFVSSLGPCLLAGALDVVHHPATRARYLGVFLYAGGYCILAKIAKGGKVYEPRHWFALNEVEVEDVEEDDASFPYSFSINGFGHHLRLGSSCPQEKTIWLSAINKALAGNASWKNEPFSSFQADDKTPPPLAIPFTDEPQESPNGLPTIQSLSELEKQSDAHHEFSANLPAAPIFKYSKTLSKLDGMILKQDMHPQHGSISAALSRRSSTTSVKAFFAPFESSRITRPTSTTRTQIEHALHDVFSESCLAARSQAHMRGEELFQLRAPGSGGGRRQGNGMSRSNSGISLANAMGLGAAKRKYDARRNRSVDLDMPVPPLPPMPADIGAPAAETGAVVNCAPALSERAKSLAIRRHKKQPASIAPAISTAIAQMSAEKNGHVSGVVQSPEALSLDSPPDASHRSSVSSMLPSPVEMTFLPIPVPGFSPNGTVRQSDVSPIGTKDAKPKRTRSMVENVRFFFQQSRSDSPSPSSSSDPDRSSPTPPPTVDGPLADFGTGIVQWLRRTSIRRRPSGSSSPSSASIEDPSLVQRHPLPTRNSTDGVNVRNADFLASPQSRLRTPTLSPKRHRSLFVPSSRSQDRHSFLYDDRPLEEDALHPNSPTRSHSSLSTKKSLRNLLLFQRSSALTSVDPTR